MLSTDDGAPEQRPTLLMRAIIGISIRPRSTTDVDDGHRFMERQAGFGLIVAWRNMQYNTCSVIISLVAPVHATERPATGL